MNIKLFNELIQAHGFKALNFKDVNFAGNQYVKEKTKKKTFILHDSAGWDNARNMYHGWSQDKLGRVATGYGVVDNGNIYRGFDVSDYYAYAIYIQSPYNRLPKSLQKFQTKKHDTFLNSQAIQVEVCNWGWLKEKGINFYSYTDVKIPPHKVVYYKDDDFFKNGYRGKNAFEKITDAEIKALETLIFYHKLKDNLRITYNHDMWDISERAIRGAEGIWSHTTYRTDKLDIHPQQELVSMLMRVEDDFHSIFNDKNIKLLNKN